MLLPFALLPGVLTPRPLWTELAAISWPTAASALYLALFCSVYAYYIWYTGVEKLGAVRTATFIYLNPLFAVITGIMLLGESLKLLAVAGGLMIILGVYLTNKSAAGRQQATIAKEQKCRTES
jgi:drug/metabolite transporter (DMT)-like permease